MIQTWKFQFSKNYQICSLFLSKCETFVRTFNLHKAYRHTIPFAWHIFRYKTSPEMTSKQNSNVKIIFEFQFQTLSLTKMLQTWFLKIFLHPYYSSRIGWNILLYESLWFTILVCFTRVLSQKLKKHPQNWIFKFFSLITFFFGK